MHFVHGTILTLAATTLLATSASAQSSMFRDVTATHLPSSLAGPCMDAAAGDIDSDSDPDLALAMEFQPNILLLNDGDGVFTDVSQRLPRTAHDSEDVAFADFDADGDLDLVFVSEDDRTDELWFNDGHGTFSDVSERLVTDDVSNALAVMDLNDDGLPDLLTGNIGIDLALINDGQGGFRNETTQRWPQAGESRTQDLELADVDGDGDQDVLVANEGQNQLFVNEQGILEDVTQTSLPVRNDETREIRAADVDGDDDLDLLVANVQFAMEESAQDYLLLNDGNGVFTDASAASFPEDARSNFTVQVVDLDSDGDLDVLAPSTVFERGKTTGDYLVLLNDGTGSFSIAPPDSVLPVAASGNGFDIEVTDFDGDGRTDLFLCNRASLRDDAINSGGLQRLLQGLRDNPEPQ